MCVCGHVAEGMMELLLGNYETACPGRDSWLSLRRLGEVRVQEIILPAGP